MTREGIETTSARLRMAMKGVSNDRKERGKWLVNSPIYPSETTIHHNLQISYNNLNNFLDGRSTLPSSIKRPRNCSSIIPLPFPLQGLHTFLSQPPVILFLLLLLSYSSSSSFFFS